MTSRLTELGYELLLVALLAIVLVPLGFLRAPDVVLLLSDRAAVGISWVQQGSRGE